MYKIHHDIYIYIIIWFPLHYVWTSLKLLWLSECRKYGILTNLANFWSVWPVCSELSLIKYNNLWKLYDQNFLFLINNFRYLCYKGREEVCVDDITSLVFEFKYWWWSDAIIKSIFNVILVHLTILFVTELIPIFIGIDNTFGSKVRIHYRKLVWILMVGSTPFLDRMAKYSSASTSSCLVTASSSAPRIKFGYVVCPWESGFSGKSQVSGDRCREIIILVLKWLFRIIKEFKYWVIRNRIADGVLFF